MACSKEKISDSVCGFTLDLYKQCVQQQPSKNAFMSTTSVMLVMTMLKMGARENTEEQISRVLRLNGMDKDAVAKEMENFFGRFKATSKSVTLQTGNGLFPKADNVIKDEYVKFVKDHFKTVVKTMDYKTKADDSRQEINKWVEAETKGKIKDLLPSGSLNDLTAMVVVSAIYFKGDWMEKFKQKSTSSADFYVDAKMKFQVKMMRKKFENFPYAKLPRLACQAVELPYTDGEIGMVILLPDEIDGLAKLETELKSEDLKNIVNGMRSADVSVQLPKFKMESSYQMKELLSALGMPDLFDDQKADLSGIGKGLYVSDVFHKVFVDVNEEGTEAAAATSAAVMLRCVKKEYRFFADHPFMFMIWDHKLDVPLFIGRMTNPESTVHRIHYLGTTFACEIH